MPENAEAASGQYIAILLSRSSGEGDYEPLYCEDIVLVHVGSLDEARERAQQRGERDTTTYTAADGGTVRWSFEQVVDVSPALDADLTRDADLYARFFRDHRSYRAFDPLLDGDPL